MSQKICTCDVLQYSIWQKWLFKNSYPTLQKERVKESIWRGLLNDLLCILSWMLGSYRWMGIHSACLGHSLTQNLHSLISLFVYLCNMNEQVLRPWSQLVHSQTIASVHGNSRFRKGVWELMFYIQKEWYVKPLHTMVYKI